MRLDRTLGVCIGLTESERENEFVARARRIMRLAVRGSGLGLRGRKPLHDWGIGSILSPMGHRDVFAAALGEDAKTLPLDFDRQLTEQLASAQKELPGLPLSPEEMSEFVAHLAHSKPPEAEPRSWLNALFFKEFLLCWAAARGREAAMRLLIEEYVKPACRVAAGSPERVHELVTNITSRLLFATDTAPARIHSYSGRGPLGAWLRVVAKRGAIDIRRGESRRPTAAEEFAQRALKVVDPELDFFKFRYARQFNEALEEVLSSLDAEDANLLYLTSVEEVSSDAIAQMRHVSRRTIQRRLLAIREEVLNALREQMRERLGASEDEIESLLGLVQSQLGVTLHRVLARPTPQKNES